MRLDKLDKLISKEEEARFKVIFDKLATVLIQEGLSPKASLILLSAMSEAMYRSMIDDPDGFVKSDITTIIYGKNQTK